MHVDCTRCWASSAVTEGAGGPVFHGHWASIRDFAPKHLPKGNLSRKTLKKWSSSWQPCLWQRVGAQWSLRSLPTNAFLWMGWNLGSPVSRAAKSTSCALLISRSHGVHDFWQIVKGWINQLAELLTWRGMNIGWSEMSCLSILKDSAPRGIICKSVFWKDAGHLMCIRVFKPYFGIYLHVPAFRFLIALGAWGQVFGFGQMGHLCCANWFLLEGMNGEHRAPGLRMKTKQKIRSLLFGDVSAFAVWMGEVWQATGGITLSCWMISHQMICILPNCYQVVALHQCLHSLREKEYTMFFCCCCSFSFPFCCLFLTLWKAICWGAGFWCYGEYRKYSKFAHWFHLWRWRAALSWVFPCWFSCHTKLMGFRVGTVEKVRDAELCYIPTKHWAFQQRC